VGDGEGVIVGANTTSRIDERVIENTAVVLRPMPDWRVFS
jgi:hypothetical protein